MCLVQGRPEQHNQKLLCTKIQVVVTNIMVWVPIAQKIVPKEAPQMRVAALLECGAGGPFLVRVGHGQSKASLSRCPVLHHEQLANIFTALFASRQADCTNCHHEGLPLFCMLLYDFNPHSESLWVGECTRCCVAWILASTFSLPFWGKVLIVVQRDCQESQQTQMDVWKQRPCPSSCQQKSH